MKTEVVQAESEAALHRAARVLRGGGLTAFPTDTVYGVAALPWDAGAVAKLYVAKQRPRSMPIPLLLSDADQLSMVATLAPELEPLTSRFWPGGLTLVLPKSRNRWKSESDGSNSSSFPEGAKNPLGGELAPKTRTVSQKPAVI